MEIDRELDQVLRSAMLLSFKRLYLLEPAQGTPTRSAETTGSVGEADGGPVRRMRHKHPRIITAEEA